jgi:hypothetical protein
VGTSWLDGRRVLLYPREEQTSHSRGLLTQPISEQRAYLVGIRFFGFKNSQKGRTHQELGSTHKQLIII